MSLIDDVAAYLATKSVGTVGTDLFKGFLPDTPANCVAIFEYAGFPPEIPNQIYYPGLQVRVRNTSYSTGRAKLKSIEDELHGLVNTTLTSTIYLWFFAEGVNYLGWKNEMVEFTENYQVAKTS